jgi:hypothetical protein
MHIIIEHNRLNAAIIYIINNNPASHINNWNYDYIFNRVIDMAKRVAVDKECTSVSCMGITLLFSHYDDTDDEVLVDVLVSPSFDYDETVNIDIVI